MPRSSGTLQHIRQQKQQGRARSQLQGVAGVRKLIRQLPTAVKEEMADELQAIAPDYLAAVKAFTPVAKTAHRPGYEPGALRDAITAKVLRTSLRLRVGLIGRRANREFFYGRIIEFGRKHKTVTIKRGPRAGHKLEVQARKGFHFLFYRRERLKTKLQQRLNPLFDHALARASQGTDIDG